MKHDDPKLTAFALGELTEREIAEVEQMFRADRDAATEIQETRDFADILRETLHQEPAGELRPDQRDAIFRAASIAQTTIRPSEVPAPLMIDQPRWWDRPGPWQAVAACAIVAFTVFAMNTKIGREVVKEKLDPVAELTMPVPIDPESPSAIAGDPHLISPEHRGSVAKASAPLIDPKQPGAPAPRITPSGTDVKIPVDGTPRYATTTQDPQAVSEARIDTHVSRPPRPVAKNGNGNPEVVNRLAAASIARSENKPGTISDDLAAVYLNERMKEASGMKAGNTYSEFTRVFRPMAGSPGRYEMIRMPSIKVDANFGTPDGKPLTEPPTGESRLLQISKPYLE